MRRRDREITDSDQLEELLRQGRELSLAMLDGDRPYVLPLNYGYADNCLYIHCARQGKKLDCLRQNPHVCFTVSEVVQRIDGDKACDWSTRFRSLVGSGTAEILEDRDQVCAGYDVLMRHFGGPVGNYDENLLDRSLLIRVRIEQLNGKQSL